jgi:hypothetical protein
MARARSRSRSGGGRARVAARTRVTTRDRGYRRFFDAATRGSNSIEVGVLGPEAAQPHPRGRGLTVAEVADLARRGSGRAPPRDFVSAWYARSGAATQRAAVDAIRASLRGGSVRRGLEAVGRRARDGMRAEMARMAPLAPSTVERKGSSAVLVETGAVRRAVSFRVLPRRPR